MIDHEEREFLLQLKYRFLPFTGLYLASYESESPENQTEKDRWKSLR